MKSEIYLLSSGSLGLNVIKKLSNKFDIKFIGTDIKSTEIISFAKKNNINLFIGNPRKQKISSLFSFKKKKILFSINYLFLIEIDLIKKFEHCINIHGSLLPKYRGRTPHVWSIINNEKFTGITTHYITEKCDEGDIILQKKIPINKNDTGYSILMKFSKLYPQIIIKTIELCLTNKVMRKIQNNNLSTYFPKRNPSDGEIDWDWDKERIRNWVRALSYPYPGAYTFYQNKKITIDKVSLSKITYDINLENGYILKTKPYLLIKTKNGVIKIDEIRKNTVKFVSKKIFKSEYR